MQPYQSVALLHMFAQNHCSVHALPCCSRYLLLQVQVLHDLSSPWTCCIAAHVNCPPSCLSQLLHSVTLVPEKPQTTITAEAQGWVSIGASLPQAKLCFGQMHVQPSADITQACVAYSLQTTASWAFNLTCGLAARRLLQQAGDQTPAWQSKRQI